MRRPQSQRTQCRSLGVSLTAFIAHPPDLQNWSLMDMDFAVSCPLVRPALPRIRFLFVRSRFCSTLPSDSSSRFCPCASLVLHLHQVAQGTFTPKLPDMSDTQDAARRLTPVPRCGIRDDACARRSAARQVGTKGCRRQSNKGMTLTHAAAGWQRSGSNIVCRCKRIHATCRSLSATLRRARPWE